MWTKTTHESYERAGRRYPSELSDASVRYPTHVSRAKPLARWIGFSTGPSLAA